MIATYSGVLVSNEERYLKEIGLRIKKIRLLRKLSQAQVAFELGTSTKHYQRIEYGEVNTGIISLYKISKILETDIGEILQE